MSTLTCCDGRTRNTPGPQYSLDRYLHSAQSFIKILQAFGPYHVEGRAASIRLGIFSGEDKGNKFPGVVGMKMGKKDMRNLRNGRLCFQ